MNVEQRHKRNQEVFAIAQHALADAISSAPDDLTVDVTIQDAASTLLEVAALITTEGDESSSP